MVFISERIINISELEALLSATRLRFEILIDELQKETPQTEKIQGLSCAIRDNLVKAENFEFHIENKKCFFKETSESPMSVENPKCAGNYSGLLF